MLFDLVTLCCEATVKAVTVEEGRFTGRYAREVAVIREVEVMGTVVAGSAAGSGAGLLGDKGFACDGDVAGFCPLEAVVVVAVDVAVVVPIVRLY